MTPRQKVFALAEKFKATITERGDSYNGWDIMVDTPANYVWTSCGDLHCFVANNEHWPQGGKTELWEDLLERMQPGIELCELPNCEVCNNL